MLSLTIFFLTQTGPSVENLNELLKKKDIKALSALSTGDGSEFNVLRGGAYSVGQFGWKVVPLEPGWGKKYVVFTTPLTSEDIGELLFERVGGKLKYIPETQVDGLRLRHHALTVKFDIGQKQAILTDTVNADAKTSTLGVHVLRFSPCYKISKLTKSGKPQEYAQAGGIVLIPAQTPGPVELSMSYAGKVDLPQYAGAIVPDHAQLTNDYWYPMVNRMPTTYDITVYPPADNWKVIAQGKPMGQVEGGGVRYKMDMPAIYWSLSVAKMQQTTEKIDGRTFHTWSARMSPEAMQMQNQLFSPIIKHYSKSFSEYPFESWGGLDSLIYGGGALEAYSFATYGGQWLPDEDPHEPAHTWWGGVIPNTYLKSFWNESFAVWSEGFYKREVPIGNNFERREAFSTVSMPTESFNSASLMKSGVDIGSAAGDLGYGKGALVLSMLEQLIGTAAFLECLQEWIRVHPNGEPGEWEDFEAVVLKRLPQFQLKSFFDDWFRRPGFAKVKLVNPAHSKALFTAGLVWDGPSFRMPLELWFENAVGTRQRITIDTAKVVGDRISINMPDFKPVKVYLDPYHKALRTGANPSFDSFSGATRRMKVYRDPKQTDTCKVYETTLEKLGEDLSDVLILGHPDTEPRMKDLCAKAGFAVSGKNLTYYGTTINLSKAAAFAVVPLENGKRCAIGLGTCLREPDLGHARKGLVESLGRFLRGETQFPGKAQDAIKLN